MGSFKEIKKLNNLLGEALGFVGNESRYAWRRTASLFYFIQEGTKEIEGEGFDYCQCKAFYEPMQYEDWDLDAGDLCAECNHPRREHGDHHSGAANGCLWHKAVVCVVPNYTRHSWAEMLGHDQWMLAHWQKPSLTEQQWLTSFGNEFPYPHAGQYYAIENATPGPGVEPTEEDTRLVIARIKNQISQNFRQLVTTAEEQAQKPIDEATARSDDMIDSDWPAFDNLNAREDRLGQSRGGPVSFGGV
jgi:hypothetical protein